MRFPIVVSCGVVLATCVAAQAQTSCAEWSTLGNSTNGYVNWAGTFDDGSGPALYVGGLFTATADGTAASKVARWNGSSWSALGLGFDVTSHSMAVFDDGSGPAMFVGGEYFHAGGQPANRIAKWNGS